MDVKTRILDAALGLLARGGAQELTQPRICKAAGLRQSHLTYYFPTRADLLQAVARHSIEALAAELATRKLDPGALAEALAAGAADKRRIRVMLGLVAAADRDPAIKRRLRRFIRELRGRMAGVFASAGLELDEEAVAFLHTMTVGAAVLQLARDDAAARAEAKAVLKKAAACIGRERP